MRPTFREGDILVVRPYKDHRLRRGDVIVFHPPGDINRRITHRVVAVTPEGIITKGDNNKETDPWLLGPDEIVGRVVYVRRGERLVRIHGGLWGRLMLWIRRLSLRLDTRISPVLSPFYHWLARSGILRRLIPQRIRPRVIAFNRTNGREMHLMIGHHVIGRLMPGSKSWQIRRPFRLFIDEASLPTGEDKEIKDFS
jgi:signal peptidase